MDVAFELRYRAASSRDARFDGQFFTAVTSTGIYCRPVCAAMTPKREHMRFFDSAAAAVEAGFRPCRRCRPDAAPQSAEWDPEAELARRALGLIAGGALDTGGVAALAARLHVSDRHLHRVLVSVMGVGPLAIARTRRVQTARVLIEQTGMAMTDIALAAGFSSIRQFNAAMREALGATPTSVRRTGAADGVAPGALLLRLRAQSPFDGGALFGFLGSRAIPGVEEVTADGTLRRSLRVAHGYAVMELTATDNGAVLRVHLDDVADLEDVVIRCRRLLDVDAEPAAISAVLRRDRLLAAQLRAHPGLRVPGCVDPFEFAVRAVLGQQVSVAGARTLAGRLAARHGTPLPRPLGRVTLGFPAPAQVMDADLDGLGVTGGRIRTLRALAGAVTDGSLTLVPGADPVAARRRLLEIPGIGPWTASYIAMRALGDPDAFPAGDLGLRRAFDRAGVASDVRSIEARAAAWQPWRAYAAMHLWNTPVERGGSS